MQGYALLFGLGIVLGTLLTPVQYWLVVQLIVVVFLLLFVYGFRVKHMLSGIIPPGISTKPRTQIIRGPKSRALNIVCLLLGMLWGCFWLQQQLQSRLPVGLDKMDLVLAFKVTAVRDQERGQQLDVEVTGIPSREALARNHRFLPDVELPPMELPPIRRLQLSIQDPQYSAYGIDKDRYRSGDRMTALVRLKAIRSMENGLVFDYEAMMLRRGFDAKGYVRELIAYHPVDTNDQGVLRNAIITSKQQQISVAAWPWVAGLVFGVQDAFDSTRWQLTQQTGTLHLLVVSGLHMGMMAGAVILTMLMLQRLFAGMGISTVCSRMGGPIGSAAWLRAWMVIAIGTGYVYMAGAGIALQRAWIMLVAATLMLLLIRKLSLMAGLAYAFCFVLAINPMVYTGAGFGFSMTAVAGLLAFIQARKVSRWQLLWLSHWVVFLCLVPVMLFWGQSVSLVHLLCNFVGIPVLGILLLPLSFLTALFPGSWCEQALILIGDGFWWMLELATTMPVPSLQFQSIDVLLAYAILLLLLWVGVRPLFGVVATLSTLLMLHIKPAPYRADRLVMADVGQGQAVVVTYGAAQGRVNALIVDTGPRFSAEFDAGSAIVAPMASGLGVQKISDLIVSHSDTDHSGGWEGIVNSGLLVESHWYGQMDKLQDDFFLVPDEIFDCHWSDQWHQRGPDLAFRFLVLAPYHHHSDNDASCVVQILWHDQMILIPGDVSKLAEMALAYRYQWDLKSDILIAAHHGSRTSSSSGFLHRVNPSEIWISAGFNNRFGHPHPEVLERLQAAATKVYITSETGAVVLTPQGEVITTRSGWQPPWRQSQSFNPNNDGR